MQSHNYKITITQPNASKDHQLQATPGRKTVRHMHTEISNTPISKFMEESLQPLDIPHSPYNGHILNNKPAVLKFYQTPHHILRQVNQLETIRDIYQKIDFDGHSILNSENRHQDSNNQSDPNQNQSQSQESSESNKQQPYKTPRKTKQGTILINIAKQGNFSQYLNQQSNDNEVNPKNPLCCNCKKSRCLKLYCDCFRVNKICEGCNCVSCLNTAQNHDQRYNAMLSLMEKYPDVFKPKIQGQKHTKGCNCRKSNCLKKYCECYQAGLKCSQLCKCQECKNTKQKEGKESKSKLKTTVKKQGRYDSNIKKNPIF